MQSKKVWYIFLGNHHKGPYTLNEIDSMILRGRAPFDVPIWMNGMEGWVSHSVLTKHLRDPEQNVPDIPKNLAADYIDIPDIPQEALNRVEKSGGDEVLDLPVNHSNETNSIKVTLVESDAAPVKELGSNILFQERDPDLDGLISGNKKSKWFATFLKITAIVAVMGGILAGSAFYYFKTIRHFSRPQGMELSDYRRLVSIVDLPGVKVAEFAFSKDKSRIWMSSNYLLDTFVNLTVRSMDGKLIGQQMVEVVANGIFTNGLAQFAEIEFLSGTTLIPGKYLFTVEGEKTPKLKWWQKWSPDSNKQLLVKSEVTIGFHSEAAYESALHKYVNDIIQKKINLLTELHHKYKTLIAVSSQLEEHFKKLLSSKRRLADARKFEREYTMSYGTLLTSLITSSGGEFALQFEKYSEFKEVFNLLPRFTGELGDSAMEILANIKKGKRMSSKQRKLIGTMVKERVVEVKISCLQQIYKIQGHLQDLNSQVIQ